MPDLDARLEADTAAVHAEIARADTKSSALLAAFGLPLAVLVAAAPGAALPWPAAVLVGAGAVGLVAALVIVLTAVRPRLDAAPRGSYLYWARCTPAEVLADPATLDDRAAQLVRLSQIARRKYKALRLAGDLTCIALLALTAGLLITLI